jgi:hypothetical protein
MARELVTVSLEERSYIPNDWKDEKGKPEAKALTIKFKPLSKRQLAHYSDNSSRLNIGSNTISLGNAVGNLELFRASVTGWDNLVDNEGKDIKFKRDASGLIAEDLIELIWEDVIQEVATHILKVSKFPEEEKGK